MGGVGWLEKWGIKLSHLSTEVEVEVEDELGNIPNMDLCCQLSPDLNFVS